jgi:hypothetical protein
MLIMIDVALLDSLAGSGQTRIFNIKIDDSQHPAMLLPTYLARHTDSFTQECLEGHDQSPAS